jgi:hypothetical protein
MLRRVQRRLKKNKLHQAISTGAAAPVFLASICLTLINLPVHFRVHNLPLIYFGFSHNA